MQWPVQICIQDSSSTTTFEAEVHNLSKEGVLVDCSQALVSHLLVLKEPFPECPLQISTPDDTGIIKVLCRLIVSRRLSQDSYQLGFKALRFEGSSETLLDRHLAILESETR